MLVAIVIAAFAPGFGDDARFLLVVLGVQDVVRDAVGQGFFEVSDIPAASIPSVSATDCITVGVQHLEADARIGFDRGLSPGSISLLAAASARPGQVSGASLGLVKVSILLLSARITRHIYHQPYLRSASSLVRRR